MRSAAGPTDWATAASEAADAHPLAAELHIRHGAPSGYRRTRPEQRFAVLARSIAYQQLNGRAASTIWARVEAVVDEPITPSAVAAAPYDDLRSAGLSNAKALALADLAARALDGSLDLASTSRMSDEDVVAHLTQVRGIGPWSAQMFLISSLGRTDVWPTGDLGVRVGWARATGSPAVPTSAELEEAGQPFRPHRSVLAWWCWQETDTEELT